MASGVPPALVRVLGAVGTEGSGEGLAPDADAALAPAFDLLGGAAAHHVHHVQRARDLGHRGRACARAGGYSKRVVG